MTYRITGQQTIPATSTSIKTWELPKPHNILLLENGKEETKRCVEID